MPRLTKEERQLKRKLRNDRVHAKFEKHSKDSKQVGVSFENKQWSIKRSEMYNQHVWKGWDRSEKPSEVKRYNINDIKD